MNMIIKPKLLLEFLLNYKLRCMNYNTTLGVSLDLFLTAHCLATCAVLQLVLYCIMLILPEPNLELTF